VETELQMRIRDYAATFGGRVQLAIEAFSNAFEVIPRTLAENSGFDPIDKVVALKKVHADGKKYAGSTSTPRRSWTCRKQASSSRSA